ncbi:MAG: alpha/beta fold hydrolase [Proteobacteria bacterium]|nr:alpha/beta fold hydrolase [Pseudomonadota bacterium]
MVPEPVADVCRQPPSGRALPTLVGHRALRLFCTPSMSRHRAPDHDVLVERARFHLRDAQRTTIATSVGRMETYLLEPQNAAPVATVLLVHGWTGEAAFMSAFADFFGRRGMRVLLVDMPAHGDSPGRYTSLMDCARGISDVAAAYGRIDFAVGHSIGGLAVLLAAGGRPPMPRSIDFRAIVAIASPDRFLDVTRRFGSEQRLDERAQADFERRLERLAHRPISQFTGSNLIAEASRPVLLLHARDDDEVPFADAERMAGAAGQVELQAFDGLGHRAILYAPPVVRAAHAFLSRRM